METELASEMYYFFKKLYDWQRSHPPTPPPKKRLCQLTSIVLCSFFLMGLIGFPETSVRNYYSTLHNIPAQPHPSRTQILHDNLAMQFFDWLCMVWFGTSYANLR
jgi:hypothetical protein